MASLFSRIVSGEIPCYKVAETDDFLAFLDINPLTKGHTLCIPKEEVDYLFDLSDSQYIGLHIFAREVARAIEEAIPCKRIATAVVGLEVPHCHIHLVPINSISDLNFEGNKLSLDPEEMKEISGSIRSNL